METRNKTKEKHMTRSEVYTMIDAERRYQRRWEEEEGFDDTNWRPADWLNFIEGYVHSAKHVNDAYNHAEYEAKQMNNIRKIAALAVAAMEHNPTPRRV
jgi:hypothetical protein